MSETTNEDLDRVLALIDGYDGQTQPVEVPPSILSDAHFHLWNLAKECAALRADADALRRLEEWLAGDRERRTVEARKIDVVALWLVELDDRDRSYSNAKREGCDGTGPTLAAAIVAALEKAREVRG